MQREFTDHGEAALGEEIILGCQTVNAARTPTVPDACPTMRIWDSTHTQIVSMQIPVQDKYGRSGKFMFRQLLDSTFAVGRYWVTYDWTTNTGAYAGCAMGTFEVLPGGNANGTFLSLFHFRRPQGRFLIGQTLAGKLFLGRNPKI